MKKININWIKQYKGPNFLSFAPVVVCEITIDLDFSLDMIMLADKKICEIISKKSSLIDPEIIDNKTYDLPLLLSKLIAKSALSVLNEVRGHIKVADAKRNEGLIILWIGYHVPSITKEIIKFFTDLVMAIFYSKDLLIYKERIANIWDLCRKYHPDYQARILMTAADSANIPYMQFLSQIKCWQFGWGAKSLKFVESHSEEDSELGAKIAQNKLLSKLYMEKACAPVAKHIVVNDIISIRKASIEIGFPCVLKPIDRGQAKGVTVDIRNLQALEEALSFARKYSQLPLMQERHIEGDVYRLLVVRGKFIAATCRRPPQVIGDGKTKLIDLVNELNSLREVNQTPGSYLGLAPIDHEYQMAISSQGYNNNTILPEGHAVRIQNIPLLSRGSENIDVTDMVHEETIFHVETMAQALSISVIGFDFITQDISMSCLKMGGFIEFNIYPSLRGHLVKDKDVRRVGMQILGDVPGRLPIIFVVANNLSFKEYIEQLKEYPNMGWRFKDAAGVGSVVLKTKSEEMHSSLFPILTNKKVMSLLIVCSDEEILQHGLPMDKIDQSIIDPDCNLTAIHSLVNEYSIKTMVSKFNIDHLKKFEK